MIRAPLTGGLIDGLLGERDRLLGSGREPDIGECDSKRVHTLASGTKYRLRALRRRRRDGAITSASPSICSKPLLSFRSGYFSRPSSNSSTFFTPLGAENVNVSLAIAASSFQFL